MAKESDKAGKNLTHDEQLKLHETKYGEGNVNVIRVEDKICFLRKADRVAYGKALAHMTPIPGISVAEPLKAGIDLILLCWIDGDKEIKEDDDYLIPASMQALSLMKMKEASIKKK